MRKDILSLNNCRLIPSALNPCVLLLTVLIAITLAACKKNIPTGPELNYEVKVEEVSSTEAWLRIKTNGEALPVEGTCEITPGKTKSIFLISSDTLLYIGSLLPNKNYNIQLSLKSGNQLIMPEARPWRSELITLDTSSHDFTWQSWTYGEHSNSCLYDVAIINENDIWAVGEIYLRDSLGEIDYKAHNAVHWDGREWKVTRIKYSGACSALDYPCLYSINSLPDDSKVVSNGGSIGYYASGNVLLDCGINSLLAGAVKSIWISQSNEMFVIGLNGSFIKYNGRSWIKISTGTDLNIYDIWGTGGGQSAEIMLGMGKLLVNQDRKIFTYNNSELVEHTAEGIIGTIYGVWFKSGRKYYTCGNGVFVKENIYDDQIWRQAGKNLTTFFLNSIRGSALNDIFTCGAYGEVLHFNGWNWRSYYNELQMNGSFITVEQKNDIVVIVGREGRKAKIVMGRRR